jgi:hypothetical protein
MKAPGLPLCSVLLLAAVLPGADVHVVKFESQADVKVFVAKYESQADVKIFFVTYESQADLKVFFVRYDSQAGWRVQSPFQGRLAGSSH